MIQSVREVSLERQPVANCDREGIRYVGERQFMVVTDGQSTDLKTVIDHEKIPKPDAEWDKDFHELKCVRVIVQQELEKLLRVRAFYEGKPD